MEDFIGRQSFKNNDIYLTVSSPYVIVKIAAVKIARLQSYQSNSLRFSRRVRVKRKLPTLQLQTP